MSYNLARKIARRKTKEGDRQRPKSGDFLVDVVCCADGQILVSHYPIESGGTLTDENAQITAAKLDLAWFKLHPMRSHRLRPAVPGEVPGITTEGYVYIVVRQLKPGSLSRLAFLSVKQCPEEEAPEPIAHAIYDVVEEYQGTPIPAGEMGKRMRAYALGGDIADSLRDKPPFVH